MALAWAPVAAVRPAEARPAEARPAEASKAAAEASKAAAEAHYARAIAHFNAERFAEAAVGFEMARRLDPRHAGAHVYLGAARFKLDRPADALPLLRRGLALDPRLDGDVTRMYLALSLERLKLYRTARVAYLGIVELDARSRLAARARERIAAIDALFDPPPSALVRRHYQYEGTRAYEAGRHADAVDLLGELRRVEREVPGSSPLPDAGRSWFYLGAALNHLGRFAEALEVLEDAESAPAALAVQRGRALAGVGRRDAARRAFERARALDGDGPWGRSAAGFLDGLDAAAPPAATN